MFELCAVALLLGELSELSEPSARRPTRVQLEAPAECPPQERFERELTFRTNRVELVRDEAAATASVRVVITKKGKRFEGQLVVRTSAGRSVSKTVSSPKCQSVTAALSLATALVLDPEAKVGALPATLPPVPPPPEPEPVIVEPPTPEPPAPMPVVAPEPVRTPPAITQQPAPPPQPQPLQLTVLALGTATTAISASLDVGAGAALEVAVRNRALVPVGRVGVSAGAGRTVTSAAGAVRYPAHFGALLELGLGWELGRFRPELDVALHVTAATMSGLGADQVFSSLRWLADVGPTARVLLALGDWRLGVNAGLGVTVVRERYRIEPDGEVFAVPPLALTAGVQVGYALPR